jgi:hypothetical protein
MECAGRRWARRRKPVALRAASAALLAAAVLPAASPASEQSVAARAKPGNIITSPKPDALVLGGQVRVSLRVPGGTRRLWVRLNDRNITSRFSSVGGQRVATLSGGSGLRFGNNTLSVLAKRGGRAATIEADSFTFGRPAGGMAQLKLKPGPVTSARIRIAAPSLPLSAFDSRREFKKRFNAIKRDRVLRISLNGRPALDAFSNPRPTRWNASLSATHGLRHGVNRLRILILELDSGRFEVLRRQFMVPPGVPLPAAGPDLGKPFGLDRMPLDARDTESGDGSRSSFEWKILSEPPGSEATLSNAGTPRALLDPDRRGRYRLGLVAEGSQVVDVAEGIVGPAQMLVPFGFFVGGDRRNPDGTVAPAPPGIEVGDRLYSLPGGAPEGAMQWLTLDRETLTPIKDKNSWIHRSSRDKGHTLDDLKAAIANGGHGDLVALALPMGGGNEQPVNKNQVDEFNSILKSLGAGSLSAGSLTQGFQQLVVVGIPYSDGGGGWSSQVYDNPIPGLTGFLMPDSVERTSGVPSFRFQPEKIEFDTSVERSASSNRMNVGGETLDASLDGTATGGFQAVELDPLTLEPLPGTNQVFNTNYTDRFGGKSLTERARLVQYLDTVRGRNSLVAVQSIGKVRKDTVLLDAERSEMNQSWRNITQAMQALGANPHTFYTLGCDLSDYARPACETGPGQIGQGGAFAFLGGSHLKRSEVAESATSIVVDPSTQPVATENGTLQGQVQMRSDGLLAPALADGSDQLGFDIYDIAFSPPTAWPLTREAGTSEAEAEQYKKALAYISTCVGAFKGWGPDLRSAYAGDLNLDYDAAVSGLDKQPYPDDVSDRDTCPEWFKSNPTPGFTRFQYGVLHAELDQEMGWLNDVSRLFSVSEKALGRSGGTQLVDLKSLGQTVKKTIKPPSAAREILLDIGEFLLALGEIAAIPEGEATVGFVEFVAAVYQVGTSLASDVPGGEPLSDKIDEEVDNLGDQAAGRLDRAASGLDRIRQVINSDYGRLVRLARLAGTPAYSTADTSTMTAKMNQAAGQWFSSELLPIAFGVHAFSRAETAGGCYVTSPPGHLFSEAPENTQLNFFGAFEVDGYTARYPSPFVLGLHNLHEGPDYVPSESLAIKVFRPDSRGGYGLQLQRFIWEAYEDYRDGAPPTNIAKC